jgi:hypothetical protein
VLFIPILRMISRKDQQHTADLLFVYGLFNFTVSGLVSNEMVGICKETHLMA